MIRPPRSKPAQPGGRQRLLRPNRTTPTTRRPGASACWSDAPKRWPPRWSTWAGSAGWPLSSPSPTVAGPGPPDGWLERLRHAGGLCLTLLTPGVFSAGYRPGWLDDGLTGSPPEAPGLTLRLRAAAVARWQPHSGWDLARGRPRPARKLAPAGATYWFEVLGACDADNAAALWLASVCDEPQDRRDGFGLALPAPWTPPTDDTEAG